MAIVRIDYLGPLRVSAGERVVDVRGRRLVALLARLAMAPGRPVPVDVLAGALWPDDAPADPANALQSLVSRLRRALGDAASVEQTPAGYRLAVAPDAIDAVRFDALAAQGRRLLAARGPGGRRRRAPRRPRPLAGRPVARRGRGGRHRGRARRPCGSVTSMCSSTASTPTSEPVPARPPPRSRPGARRARRRAPAARGRRGPAPAGAAGRGPPGARRWLAFEAVREALADTLGADPSPALRALHLEALRQDAAPSTPPTTLRRPVTSFVGRDDDLRALTRRLGTDRLVTLTGAGGSGKTRLATEAAGAVLDGAPGAPGAPDGVWFAELAPVTDPADLASAVLDGLGIRDVAAERTGLDGESRRPASARERLLEVLRGQTCLVVLDNCEHLVAAAAGLVDGAPRRGPGVRLLATSREPLGIDGEDAAPARPARRPGRRRGRRARCWQAPRYGCCSTAPRPPAPRCRRGGRLWHTSRRSCRRLDGLPLALELAAARLRLLSPSEVAARLDDRFRLLTGGRRTAVPRHRTLRAVVEWSWDLLTDTEREVADHFCVFPGGATAAAVAAVCPTWRDSRRTPPPRSPTSCRRSSTSRCSSPTTGRTAAGCACSRRCASTAPNGWRRGGSARPRTTPPPGTPSGW